MPQQRSRPTRSTTARTRQQQPRPLRPGEVRELQVPDGTPPPADLYAPATSAPTPPPHLDPDEVSAQLATLRDLELRGDVPPIAGYDPIRTPEYLAQEAQQAHQEASLVNQSDPYPQ